MDLLELPQAPARDIAAEAVRLMASGGDARIVLDPVTGLNQYLVAPRPLAAIAYSSSTANDISPHAFAEVQRRLACIAPSLELSPPGYEAALDELRARIRTCWRLQRSVEVVFAASGTDLEYVALALSHREGSTGIDNILLGADEVGSGCIYSARGQFFASQTALGISATKGRIIAPGLEGRIRLIDIAIRGKGGEPVPSEDVLLSIAAAIESAIRAGRQALVHVVHGSKTGLITPSFAHIDALRRRFGADVSFVVDACQARIGRDAIAAYLARGATVFLTGSKFMGGPPFSGFALVPEAAFLRSAGLLPGLEAIFNRGEWPCGWPDRDGLEMGSNLGLLLRLEASIYELELFQKLTAAEIRRTLDLFDEAIDGLTRRLGAVRLLPHAASEWQEVQSHPLEMRTLVTLDLSEAKTALDHEAARALYLAMCEPDGGGTINEGPRSVRLGQPVKCIQMPGGGYAGMLRIGLSMPQMVEFAALDSLSLRKRLADDMEAIAARILFQS